MIRVANVAELPPGKGKVIDCGDRRVTVYNLDGRFYASSRRAHHEREPATRCAQHGRVFDAFAQDSPALLRADEQPCRVRVIAEVLWLEEKPE